MDGHEQFNENPGCRKCAAKAPLNRPEYIYHEECPRWKGEHIHLCCRRCGYNWLMATMGPRGNHELRPGSVHKVDTKWYDKSPLGRLLVPDMPSYQEKTEKFEEPDESSSRKVGWRKPNEGS